MTRPVDPDSSRPSPSSGRVRVLMAAAVLLGSLDLGIQVAPWLAERGWRPPEAPGSALVRWRRSRSDPVRDPQLGALISLPQVAASSPRERLVLLFVGEGAG